MSTLLDDIVKRARENPDFYREIVTNEHSQLALRSVEPGSDIGERVHNADQVLVVIEGTGEAVMNRQHSPVQAHSLVVVPAGTRHNVRNTGSTPLKILTLYAPPEVEPGMLLRTKAEAAETDD